LWSEHYCKLLNEAPDTNCIFDNSFKDEIDKEVLNMTNNFEKDYDNTGILSGCITINEVANVCMSMSNHKSPGYDNISYESFKYGGHILFQKVCKLYNAIIMYSYIPVAMKHSIVIPLYKGKKKPKNNVNSYGKKLY